MMPTGSDTRGRRRGAKARRAPDTSPVPSHATPRALDSISAQVAAYAKRERKNAVEAARLHADLLTSENVPSLALKYSNYLSPSAKRELLARLKPGVGKAKEAWSTARASLTGWVLQFTENASDWRSMPVALKVAAVALILLALWFAVQAIYSLAIFAVSVVGTVTVLRGYLKSRTPMLVTNEVALDAASHADKSDTLERLRLPLLQYQAQTVEELIDELWDALAPPDR